MRPAAKPELLAPAGSMESLKAAVRYGADAVYLGAKSLSLRARAKNFGAGELERALFYAHENGARVYITANIFANDDDIDEAKAWFSTLSETGDALRPDALIISDPGMIALAQKHCPNIPIHISTQANITNTEACLFWYRQGIRRVVLARELSLERIRRIKMGLPEDMEIECFVHGSVCVSYSGRCLLSRAMTGRDANRGECAHPCRYGYSLIEETRPGEYLKVEEDKRGTAILAPEDMCMAGHIDELIDAGIESFKLEGRMKNALYVSIITKCYRKAIDLALSDREAYKNAVPELVRDLKSVSDRPFTTGFFYSDGPLYADGDADIITKCNKVPRRVYTGVVRGGAKECDGGLEFDIEQRNRFFTGDELDIIRPGGAANKDIRVRIVSMTDEEGNILNSAPHPKQILRVRADKLSGEGLPAAGDIASMRTYKKSDKKGERYA